MLPEVRNREIFAEVEVFDDREVLLSMTFTTG